MIKIIFDFIMHISTIVVGAIVMIHGIINHDYTQAGVGLIIIHLPQIDRIEELLK